MTDAAEAQYLYFARCPLCGAVPTEPGVTDHECDPDRPAPNRTGFLAMFASDAAGPGGITGPVANLPEGLSAHLRAFLDPGRPAHD